MGKYEFSAPINHVETTSDTLAHRGGLCVFSRYLGRTGVYDLLDRTFGHLRKNRKGLGIWKLFHQVLCFVADGKSRHLTYFDEIQNDPGYAGAIQVTSGEMASSHIIKRFFRLFP